MSLLNPGFDDRYDPKKETRYHYAARFTHILSALILATIPIGYYTGLEDNLTFQVASWALIGFSLTFSMTYARRHKPGLCMRCARKTIVNLNEAAHRHLKAFRVFHRYDTVMHGITDKLGLCRWRLTRSLMWMLPIYAVMLGIGWITPRPWSVFAIFAVLIASFYPVVIHIKYQVFCPWCRRPDDDDDNDIEPVPDPAHGATV